jgi:hypothetical protein
MRSSAAVLAQAIARPNGMLVSAHLFCRNRPPGSRAAVTSLAHDMQRLKPPPKSDARLSKVARF